MRIYTHLSSFDLVNQYLIINEERKEAVLVDAPLVDSKIIETIEKGKLDLKAILITHSHEAHIASLGTLYKIYNPKLYSYFDSISNYESNIVRDGDIISEAGFEIKCLHIPGHSLDSICYLVDYALFTGDTLESGLIAETRSLVEKELLVTSIKEKLLVFDDNTLIFPGHGPLSKIRIEKLFNQDILETSITMS